MSVKHAHCWHFTSGMSNFAGGSDTFRCCRCGEFITKAWRPQPNPKHGPYAANNDIKVYEGGWHPESAAERGGARP